MSLSADVVACTTVQGVSKGGMVEAILTAAARTGSAPDFVLCIGDDRSDEDMFTAMEHVTFSPHLPAEVSRMQVVHLALHVHAAPSDCD